MLELVASLSLFLFAREQDFFSLFSEVKCSLTQSASVTTLSNCLSGFPSYVLLSPSCLYVLYCLVHSLLACLLCSADFLAERWSERAIIRDFSLRSENLPTVFSAARCVQVEARERERERQTFFSFEFQRARQKGREEVEEVGGDPPSKLLLALAHYFDMIDYSSFKT